MGMYLHTVRDGPRSGRVFLSSAKEPALATLEANAERPHAHVGLTLRSCPAALSLQCAPLVWISASVRIPEGIRSRLAAALSRTLPWDDDDILYAADDSFDLFSLSWADRTLTWSMLHPIGTMASSTPRWRHGRWDPADTLLGRITHEEHMVDRKLVDIPMPEGTYRWDMKVMEVTERRPRWFSKTFHRYDLNALPFEYIPLSNDNCYGLSFPAGSDQAAIDHVVQNLVEDRHGDPSYCRGGKYDS